MFRESLGLAPGVSTPPWVNQLKQLFIACRNEHPDDFDTQMPFGHGLFANVTQESPELNRLWTQRIRLLIRRPLRQPHPFTSTIEDNYPWKEPTYTAAATPPMATATDIAPMATETADSSSSDPQSDTAT